MPRWVRWGMMCGLGLLLLLGLGLAIAIGWLKTESGNQHVVALASSALSRSTGLELDLGRIALRGRRVAIGPIAVRDPAADSVAAPLAEIKAVRLEIDWLRLLVQRGRIRTLTIEEPVITVPRSPSGALAWPKLGREKTPGAPVVPGPKLPFVRFVVDELAIRNGRLLLAAPPAGGRAVTVDSLDLVLGAEIDLATPRTAITVRELTGVWREGELALDAAAARLIVGPLVGPRPDLQLSTTPWRFRLAAAPITLALGAQSDRGMVEIDAPHLPPGGLATLHPALARLPEMSLHLRAEGPLDLAQVPIELELEAIGARATLAGEIRSPRRAPSLHVAKLVVTNLDPRHLHPRAPQGRLSFSAKGDARRLETGLEATFQVQVAPGSRLRERPVTGKFGWRMSAGVWTIDDLGLDFASIRVQGDGSRSADGRLGASLAVVAPDLAPLGTLLDMKLEGDAQGQVRVDGPPKALRVTATIDSRTLEVADQVAVHGLVAALDLRRERTLTARLGARADSISARAGAHLQAVELSAAADPGGGGGNSRLGLRLHAAQATVDRTALPPGALDLAAHGQMKAGTLEATIDTLALAGVAELRAPLAITRRPNDLQLKGLDLELAGGRLTGDFTQARAQRTVTCDLREIDLAQLAALAGLDSVSNAAAADTTRLPAIQGQLSATLRLSDAGGGPSGQVSLEGQAIVLGAWPMPPLGVSLASEITPATVAGNLRLEAEQDSLVVRGTVPVALTDGSPQLAWESPALDLEVHAAADSLAPYLGRVLASIQNTQPFAARFRKRLSTTGCTLAVHARGRPRDPATELTLALDFAPLDPLGPGTFELSAKRPADTLAVEARLAIEGMAAPLTLVGWTPVVLDLEQRAVSVPATAPVGATLDLSAFDLRLLDAFEESDFEGLLTVSGTLSGTRSAPEITGHLALERGAIDERRIGLELDSLAVAAEVIGKQLILHSATGRTKKGHLRMQGALPLTGDPAAGVELEAEVEGLSLRTRGAVKALGDANLVVTGTMAKPVLKGKLVVREASIPLPEKGRKEMVKIPADDPWLKGTRVASGNRPPLQSQQLPFDLNLTVEITRNLWLRNDDINVEIGGDLKLTTPEGSLRVEGDLKTRQGSVRMLNRRFQVTKGSVNFFGARTLLPTIDIEAETKVRETMVTIHLTGTVEEPKLDFTSNPSQSESDIVSLLLFGRTSSELSSGETNFVQEQAGTVAASYVSAQLEREVGQKLGLDVFEINAAEGNERVAVGKYVSSNTLLRAYQEMGTESYGGVAVEHALTQEFDLEVTADDRGQSGIDLLWKRGD